MSSSDSDTNQVESRGKCLRRHKIELKALTDSFEKKIKMLKDKKEEKKCKKEFELEEKMTKERHEMELRKLSHTSSVEVATPIETDPNIFKKRLKKFEKLAKLECEQQMLEKEMNESPGCAENEKQILIAQLKSESLVLYPVPGDGNCLFSSVLHQLYIHKLLHLIDLPNKSVACFWNDFDNILFFRRLVIDNMRNNIDDYAPFLIGDGVTDVDVYFVDMISPESCRKAWGGECELKSICNLFGINIQVFNADSLRPMEFEGSQSTQGEDREVKTLKIALRRKALGGAHYDSSDLLPKNDDLIACVNTCTC
eukprot:GDKJ01032315.1.p1 GENE.GDKJ01032315.1~~GDKJ01032315.1.p1  ORF type:complete len:318 (+),score=63.06 GDKJ01032315.1:24-956(+)